MDYAKLSVDGWYMKVVEGEYNIMVNKINKVCYVFHGEVFVTRATNLEHAIDIIIDLL